MLLRDWEILLKVSLENRSFLVLLRMQEVRNTALAVPIIHMSQWRISPESGFVAVWHLFRTFSLTPAVGPSLTSSVPLSKWSHKGSPACWMGERDREGLKCVGEWMGASKQARRVSVMQKGDGETDTAPQWVAPFRCLT